MSDNRLTGLFPLCQALGIDNGGFTQSINTVANMVFKFGGRAYEKPIKYDAGSKGFSSVAWKEIVVDLGLELDDAVHVPPPPLSVRPSVRLRRATHRRNRRQVVCV